jgi:hypothetical protein
LKFGGDAVRDRVQEVLASFADFMLTMTHWGQFSGSLRKSKARSMPTRKSTDLVIDRLIFGKRRLQRSTAPPSFTAHFPKFAPIPQ